MGGKVKLSPTPSSTADNDKLDPPPSSTVAKVKLGPSPSSSGWIFRASCSWRAKLVEVIDLISFDEYNDDVMPPRPSYRYEVESDDEDSDSVLPPPPPPSSPECHKRKATVANYNNKKV
jgi:hypothetical protein